MYLCMYVCMCVCMYVCIDVYIYIYIYTHIERERVAPIKPVPIRQAEHALDEGPRRSRSAGTLPCLNRDLGAGSGLAERPARAGSAGGLLLR